MQIDFTSDINERYRAALDYPAVDRFMVRILWCHFAVFIPIALTNSLLDPAARFGSPFSWRVISPAEAIVSGLVALLAAAAPTFLRGKSPNHYAWRVLVTCCLTTYSYLFIFISGGAIEMHFHFFMMMALLVIYADWRLGWFVLVLAGLHHTILNYLAPGWVYSYGRNDLSVVAHAIPVLAMAIFTTILCETHRSSVERLLGSNRELEERHDQLLTARAQASTDGLTSLGNHRSFHERVRDELAAAAEAGTPLALLMLDVDNFKTVNDTLGHQAGDDLLRRLTLVLTNLAKQTDVYRYGGDEFALVVPGADAKEAIRLGSRLVRAVGRPMHASGITVSVGVATYPSMVKSAEELIYAADASMYRAKHAGKNCVRAWSNQAEADSGGPPGLARSA